MSTVMNPDIVTLQSDGAAAVAVGVARMVAPVSGRIVAAAVSAETAPTGADLIIDVNVGGASVFAVAGDQPTIAAGANDSAVAPATAAAAATDFVAGDVITVDVTQVGSTVAGSDLTVTIAIVGDETPA